MGTTISISGSGNADVKVYGNGTVFAGNGNDWIDITGKGKIIVGSGHDTLTLGHGGVIVEHGAKGHDTINIGSGNATIYEQGHATVTGAFGSITMAGGMLEIHQSKGQGGGSDGSGSTGSHGTGSHGTGSHGTGSHGQSGHTGGQSSGHSGSQSSHTGSGQSSGQTHSSVTGAAGSHSFGAGSSHAATVGGSGHNVFENLAHQTGSALFIKNFVSGEHQLDVKGHSFSFLEQHHEISTHDGNTYISIAGGKTTIELQGVTTLKPH